MIAIDTGLLVLGLCLAFCVVWYLVWSKVVARFLNWIERRISAAMIRRAQAPRDRPKPPMKGL